MKANILQNLAKTAVLWCASSRRQHLVQTASVGVGDVLVSPVTGVYIEIDVTMRTHATNIVRACFSELRQIRSLRRSLQQHSLLTLVHGLVITELDQCNSVLAGTAGYIPAKPAAVCAERRCSTHLFSPGVRTHNPTAPGPSLVTYTGANPVFGCVFWHIIVCTAQHRRIWQTACCRHRSSSPFAVYAAPTQRSCWCRRLSG